ncbi:MAG: recombinase family protein [Thermotaleaceae bacterium]
MKTAALYIRVSTDEQIEYSPEAQRKALIDYAKKNRILVPSEYIFIDEGISGRKAEKRPAFMEMIRLAKKKPKPFDIILVHKFDRFSRSREDSVVYKSLLRKDCGIKVASITEQLEDDKFSIILESMLEAMAEYYSLNLADEVKKGMTEKAKRGELQTGAAYGYVVKEQGKLTIVEHEAKIVQYIFDQYLNQDESFYRIAKKVNEMGALTKKNKPFDNRGIEYILRNPVYAGKLRWTPTGRFKRDFDSEDILIADGNHEPIVPLNVFETVQEKIRIGKKMYKSKRRPIDECKHWLSGLVRCSSCSATLVYTATKTPSFQCRGYTGGRCKVSHSITVKRMERAILSELSKFISHEETKSYHISTASSMDLEVDALTKQLDKIGTKLERAREAFLAGIDTIVEYKSNKELIQQEESSLRERIDKLKSKENKGTMDVFKERINVVYDMLVNDNVPMIEKQKSIRSIVSEIRFNKANDTLEVDYYL